MDYHSQKVDIVINKDSESWKRIEARAARDGVPVEFVVNVLFATRIGEFVTRQLDLWDLVDKGDHMTIRKNGE